MEASNNKKVLITAVITFCATSMAWIGIGILLYWLWTETPPPFDVTLAHPETVEVGDTFTLEVDIENSSSKSVSLGSIDLYDDLLDGFAVVSVDPKPDSKEHRWGFATSDTAIEVIKRP